MILLVDIGNSRIKWECRQGAQIHAEGKTLRPAEGLDRTFDAQWAALTPRRVVTSNVAGQHITDQLTAWCERNWALSPRFIATAAEGYGVRNGYEDYRQLGVDRWLALIAAWHRCHGASCVVDCGTAVTLDALSPNGEHLGGMILPGLALMRMSLHKHTEGIRVEEGGQPVLFARNTRDGIAAGGANAVAGGIDRFVLELKQRLGEVRCLITGGDAGYLLPLLADRFEEIPNLVLQGLAIMAEDEK
jgi:type III pantothenate kinase